MEKKKIYISGKITGIEKQALSIFKKAEEKLQKLGYDTVNPITLNHNHDKSWQSYMREGVKALCDCDAIFMLDNWNSSNGAIIEKEIAESLKLELIFETEIKREPEFYDDLPADVSHCPPGYD